jgi:hypothetical protein
MHVVLNVLDARGPGEQRGKGRGGGGRGAVIRYAQWRLVGAAGGRLARRLGARV